MPIDCRKNLREEIIAPFFATRLLLSLFQPSENATAMDCLYVKTYIISEIKHLSGKKYCHMPVCFLLTLKEEFLP